MGVRLRARRCAEGRCRAAGRDDGDGVTHVDAQRVCEAHADGDAVRLIEAFEAAELDVVGDERRVLEVFLANAAQGPAQRLDGGGDHHLAFYDRHGVDNARHGRNHLGHGVVVGELLAHLVDDDMAVEPQNLLEEILAEAVHDGHHDDERGDTQHDAEERHDGGDRNEAFLAARTQIARGKQPLECSERLRPRPSCHAR